MPSDWRMALRKGTRPERYEHESPYIDSPAWPWLMAGIVLCVCFVALLFAARSCGW